MSYPLSGEVVFNITFEKHGFPIWAYTTAAIIHVCAEQVHAVSPFNNPDKPRKYKNFKVEIVSKKTY